MYRTYRNLSSDQLRAQRREGEYRTQRGYGGRGHDRVALRRLLPVREAVAHVRRPKDPVRRSAVVAVVAGTQFNRKTFVLSFGLKNGLRFRFDYEACLNYPFLNIVLV